MKFRRKISIYIIVPQTLLVTLVCSFPQTLHRNSYNNFSPFATQPFQHETNADIWNIIQEPAYETFNFPEIENPLASKPKSVLPIEGKNKVSFPCKSRSKYLPKSDFTKVSKKASGKNEFITPPEFSSTPNYRDIANFPEVEYPLSVTDMWKPNYWNSQSPDYLYANVNMDKYNFFNPSLNEFADELKPRRNLGSHFKSGTPLITNSVSGSPKNLISVKSKDATDQKDISSIPSDLTKVGEVHLTVTPKLFTTKNKPTDDINSDMCPLNPKSVDDTHNLTTQSEILVNAYAEIFKDEIKSLLQNLAESVLTESECNTKKDVTYNQLSEHNLDVLKTSAKNLNIYDEFTSPDLLKNRRSQDLNEFTNYKKDFVIPSVDVSPKLKSTDFFIDTHTDKFHNDMTSILKSNADNFLLNTFENTKNQAVETKVNHGAIKDYGKAETLRVNHNEHLEKKFSKINNNPVLPLTDVDIDNYADKMHNEMNRMLITKADNILLNKFESSNKKPPTRVQTFTNNKIINKPKQTMTDIVNSNTAKISNQNYNIGTAVANNEMTNFEHSTQFLNAATKKAENTIGPVKPTPPEKVKTSTKITNNTIYEKEASVSKIENVINNMNTEDGMFLPVNGKEDNGLEDSVSENKEIEIEEEFTTDSYPENDWSSYGLSTVAPQSANFDSMWRDSGVIEPDRSLFIDELEQYFMMN